MPKLRRLSGDEVIAAMAKFGFVRHSQSGSHAKLRRVTPAGPVQTLTIPRHRELDTGTLRAIFRQASRFVPEDLIFPEFYSE